MKIAKWLIGGLLGAALMAAPWVLQAKEPKGDGHAGHGAAAGAQDAHGAHHAAPQPAAPAAGSVTTPIPVPPATEPSATALRAEMWQLTGAMQEILVALANNNLEAIPSAIHRVHGAREVTVQSIEKGLIRLPKNPDKMNAFIKEDDAFHDELVKLVKAARAKDLPAATRQYGAVMVGCTQCHMKYRY